MEPLGQKEPALNPLLIHSAISGVAGERENLASELCLKIEPDDARIREQFGSLFGIVDFHQGNDISAASRVLREAGGEYYRLEDLQPVLRLRRVFEKINQDMIRLAGDDPLQRVSIDLTVVVVVGDHLVLASAGTNQAYLVHDGQAQRITREPGGLTELLRKGIVIVEDAQKAVEHHDRFGRLGDHSEVDIDLIPEISIVPGDILVLCNEEVSRAVEDEDFTADVSTVEPSEVCNRLEARAAGISSTGNRVLMVLRFDMQKEALVEVNPVAFISEDTEDQSKKSYNERPRQVFTSLLNLAAGRNWKKLLVVVLCIAGLAGLGFFFSRSVNRQEKPLILPTPSKIYLSVSPTGKSTLPLQDFSTVPSRSPELAVETPAPTFVPTSSPAALLSPLTTETQFACVWKIQAGNSLFSTVRKFQVPYKEDNLYYYFPECDLQQAVCQGEKKEITAHANIEAGWYVIVPVKDQAACQAGQGAWVRVP